MYISFMYNTCLIHFYNEHKNLLNVCTNKLSKADSPLPFTDCQAIVFHLRSLCPVHVSSVKSLPFTSCEYEILARVCTVITLLYSLYEWDGTVRSCIINCLLFVLDLVLLAFSNMHLK